MPAHSNSSCSCSSTLQAVVHTTYPTVGPVTELRMRGRGRRSSRSWHKAHGHSATLVCPVAAGAGLRSQQTTAAAAAAAWPYVWAAPAARHRNLRQAATGAQLPVHCKKPRGRVCTAPLIAAACGQGAHEGSQTGARSASGIFLGPPGGARYACCVGQGQARMARRHRSLASASHD
eukprot:SAG25_NODE_2628_length_1482_cov_1.480839_1_plen_176_part_00